MDSTSCTLYSSPPSSKATLFQYDMMQDIENVSSSSNQREIYIIPMDKFTKLKEIDDKIKAYQFKLDSTIKSHETVRHLILQHFKSLFAFEVHRYKDIRHETILTRRFIENINNENPSDLDDFIRQYQDNKIRGVVSQYQKLKPINIYNILHLFLDSFGINIENIYRTGKSSLSSDVYQCEQCANLEKRIYELEMIIKQMREEINLERNARNFEVEGLRKQIKDEESEVMNLANQLHTILNDQKVKDDQLAKLKQEMNNISEKKDKEMNECKLQLTQLKNFIKETVANTLEILTQQIESLEIPQETEKLHSIKDILNKFDTMLKETIRSPQNSNAPIQPYSIITPGQTAPKLVSYCMICNKVLDMDEYNLANCGHSIHSRCLGYDIRSCPKCNGQILEYEYSQAIRKRFEVLTDVGKICRVNTDLKTCPGGCLTVISTENDSHLFDCSVCKKAYCLKCQQEAHHGDICKVVLSDSSHGNLCAICYEEMTHGMLSLRECRESYHIKCLNEFVLELLCEGIDAKCPCGADIAAEDYTTIME
jgi:hypothetical protein